MAYYSSRSAQNIALHENLVRNAIVLDPVSNKNVLMKT